MNAGSIRLLIVAALLATLGACGLKDDLFLPERPTERPPASGTAETDENEKDKARPASGRTTP